MGLGIEHKLNLSLCISKSVRLKIIWKKILSVSHLFTDNYSGIDLLTKIWFKISIYFLSINLFKLNIDYNLIIYIFAWY